MNFRTVSLSSLIILLAFSLLTFPGCTDGNQLAENKDKDKTENPKDPAGPHPKITADKTVHEFGIMAVNESQTRSFTIKNEGTAPLEIKDISYTCKCTMPDIDKVKRKLEPGESTDMPVTWTPKAPNKEFEQTVTVVSNDPLKPRLEILIRGEVEESLIFDPNQQFNVGNLPGDKAVPFKGKVYTRITDKMEILSVKPNSEYVDCKVEKMTAKELEELKASAGFHITGEVKPNKQVGNFEANILFQIKLNDQAPKDILFQVKGVHSGPINILASGYNASESRLYLGRFEASKGHKHQLTMFIKTEDKTPLEVKSVKVEPLFVKFHMEKEEKLTNDKTQVYKMFIEIPPGSPVTAKTNEEPGNITFETTHPEVPKMAFKLEFLSY